MKSFAFLLGFFVVEFAAYLMSINVGSTFSVAAAAIIPVTLSLGAIEISPRRRVVAFALSLSLLVVTNIVHLYAIRTLLSEVIKPSERLNLSSTMNFLSFIHSYGGGFVFVCFWAVWALSMRNQRASWSPFGNNSWQAKPDARNGPNP